jgi:hypothetical protein
MDPVELFVNSTLFLPMISPPPPSLVFMIGAHDSMQECSFKQDLFKPKG